VCPFPLELERYLIDRFQRLKKDVICKTLSQSECCTELGFPPIFPNNKDGKADFHCATIQSDLQIFKPFVNFGLSLDLCNFWSQNVRCWIPRILILHSLIAN